MWLYTAGMDRRTFLSALGGAILAAPLTIQAQQMGKMPRIALVFANAIESTLQGPNPGNAYARGFLDKTRELGWVDGENITIETAFATIRRARVAAMFVGDGWFFQGNIHRFVNFAAQQRLPAFYRDRLFAEQGGLLSYGPDWAELFRRAPIYVDKILRGTKPGDLPIEQPTKFELVINAKTAKALGLTISPSLLLRADQVIE